MNETRLNYHSYLIRFWHADNAGHPVWRAAVQEPGSETQIYFEQPSALWAYLDAQLEITAEPEIGAVNQPGPEDQTEKTDKSV